jgi:hypothetical protein
LPFKDSIRKQTIPKPTIDWSSPGSALESLGDYIDTCFRSGDEIGTREALNLIHQSNTQYWPANLRGQLQYFESNAWADLRDPNWDMGGGELPWDGVEVENQILALRRSILLGSQATESRSWLPMAWTNLGNALDHVGRPVEAIEAWTEALVLDPRHAMARGNHGIGLANYGRILDDSGHRALFFAAAHQDLVDALKAQQLLEPEARDILTRLLEFLRQSMKKSPAELLKVPGFPLGDSAQEEDYRRWCLDKRLFLNPLNDIDVWTIAAKDTLALPTLTSKDFQPEEWIALFNQIKQEFVSARYLIYEGLNSNEPHFSDRGVLLLNPMDYSTYSLATEKVKMGYRMAYSVFDKIAYLLNDYFELRQPEHRIGLRTVWYAKANPKADLHPKFQRRRNRALRGLYWLSKDLHEERPGFRDALLPDARELVEIRRHAEHKLLRLQDPLGIAVAAARTFPEPPRRRRLGYPLPYDVFKLRVTRLLKIARSGIMYLSFAIGEEENERGRTQRPQAPALKMMTDIFEDRWKRPPT